MKRKLAEGDRVRIRQTGTDDDWCGGVVTLVSGRGSAVAIELSGLVRAGSGYIRGMLPLFNWDDGRLTGLGDEEYELEPEPPARDDG